MKTTILKDRFEKEGLKEFEKLLHGYRRAKQSAIWESGLDNLVAKLTHLPTAPFPKKLMELFDYNYLVLSEPIETIIDKALAIRENMKDTKRYITINEKYYSLPFLQPNTHLKRLEVLNNKGELCYLQVGKPYLDIRQLLLWLRLKHRKKVKFQDVFYIKQKTTQLQQLEIYYYSNIVDLTCTDPDDYYKFFSDYYGKVQFMNYFKMKDDITIASQKMHLSLISGADRYCKVLSLTSSQQVLWAYFVFRLMGLKLRLNVEVSMLTKFLHLVNHIDLKDYKNSYFYKLLSKAPYIKEDKKLLADLEKVRIYFKEENLPAGDIEKMIADLVSD